MSTLSSPTLGVQNIVMGLIKNGYHKGGTSVGIKVRKNVRKAGEWVCWKAQSLHMTRKR